MDSKTFNISKVRSYHLLNMLFSANKLKAMIEIDLKSCFTAEKKWDNISLGGQKLDNGTWSWKGRLSGALTFSAWANYQPSTLRNRNCMVSEAGNHMFGFYVD